MFFRAKSALVLGSGGARGGAHVGVLKVLAECGYQPDMVLGTSMGGVVAAFVGAGLSIKEMSRFFLDTDFDNMITLDRSGKALISTEPLGEVLETYFGDADFRDLPLKTAVVATDVRTRTRLLIDKGPIVKALLATSSVPGLFPPIEWGDYHLNDGAISDNIPTQAAYQLGAGEILAVDLRERMMPETTLNNMGTFNSQVQRAFYWLLDLSKRQETLDTVMFSMSYSQSLLVDYYLAQFPPDLLINPELSNIGLFEMERAADAMAAGEAEARALLSEIRKFGKRKLFRWGPPQIPFPLTIASLP